MSKPRKLSNGRYMCPKCGESSSSSVSAQLCCAVSKAEGPPLPPGEIAFSYTPDTAPEPTVPDHWAAAADLLMCAVEQLRTNSMAPEDVGDYVIRVGRLMRRAT